MIQIRGFHRVEERSVDCPCAAANAKERHDLLLSRSAADLKLDSRPPVCVSNH